MLRFGFEVEYFITGPEADGAPLVVPVGIPNDAGLLAEARGKPHRDPIDAAYSLLAEQHRIDMALDAKGFFTLPTDVAVVSPETRINARRRGHTKGPVHYQNIHGYERHPVDADEMTAGLHVSVTREQSIRLPCNQRDCAGDAAHSWYGMFDYATMIRLFDEQYADEIAEAKRHPGFYEIKRDGRVEYRSLPNTVDVVEVAEFIKSNTSAIHGTWE